MLKAIITHKATLFAIITMIMSALGWQGNNAYQEYSKTPEIKAEVTVNVESPSESNYDIDQRIKTLSNESLKNFQEIMQKHRKDDHGY